MTTTKYQLLSKDEWEDFSHDPSEGSSNRNSKSATGRTILWRIVARLSICLNIALVMWLFATNRGLQGEVSQYAKLRPSETGSWTFRSEYYSHNRTDSDAHWDAIDFNPGIVALTDQEATELGLPKAERFPWDQNKGMYLINGYHNLHCLKMLWKSLARWREGATFGSLDWHSFHCVDSLRQDTLCNADDTPRYSGGEQPRSSTGQGQVRQCRDWAKLQAWAEERSACYRYLNHTVENGLDRHKFCPEGSPYNDRIERLFGPDDRARMIEHYGDVAA